MSAERHLSTELELKDAKVLCGYRCKGLPPAILSTREQ